MTNLIIDVVNSGNLVLEDMDKILNNQTAFDVYINYNQLSYTYHIRPGQYDIFLPCITECIYNLFDMDGFDYQDLSINIVL